MIRRLPAGLAAASLVAQPVFAQSCGIPPVWKPPPSSAPTHSIATVFSDPDGKLTAGSATIIDRKRRLLITASHVAKRDSVWFRFPGFDSAIFHGVVLMRIPEADWSDEQDGKAWGRARDIAIIRADDELPAIAQTLDLRMVLRTGEQLTFYGFPDGTLTPMAGTGQPSIPEPPGIILPEAEIGCTRALRATTRGGDSGSAILSENAFVVGVAAQAWHENAVNMFVPTGCFFDEVVAKIGDGGADNAYTLFTTGSPTAIAGTLAADPDRSEISNLDIYIAVARMLKEGRATDRIRCPIMWMAADRGVPLENLVFNARLSEQKIAIADAMSASVANAMGTRVPAIEKERLTLAFKLYRDVLGSRIERAYASAADVRDMFGVRDAVDLKSAADTSLLLAKLVDDPVPYQQFAQRSAALAVLSTTNQNLKGAAFATLGQASGSDQRFALQAFTSAKSQGFSPGWVASSISSLADGKGKSRPLSPQLLEKLVAGTAAIDLESGSNKR